MKNLYLAAHTHDELQADLIELFRKYEIPQTKENAQRAFSVSERVLFPLQVLRFPSGSVTLRFGTASRLYLQYSKSPEKVTIGIPGMNSEVQWLIAGQFYIMAEAALKTMYEEHQAAA